MCWRDTWLLLQSAALWHSVASVPASEKQEIAFENTHLISKNIRKHTSYKIQKYKHFVNFGLFLYPQLQLELAQMSLLVLRWCQKSLNFFYEGYKPKLFWFVIQRFQAPHISYLRSAANIPNYLWSSAFLSFAPSSKISVRVMRKKKKFLSS